MPTKNTRTQSYCNEKLRPNHQQWNGAITHNAKVTTVSTLLQLIICLLMKTGYKVCLHRHDGIPKNEIG